MRINKRRGLSLAWALAASGLVLSTAPAVHADDSNGLLVLNDTQAEQLARQLMPDIYGDGRDLSLDGAREAAEAAPEQSGWEQSTESTDTAIGSDATTSATTAPGSLKLTNRSEIEGVQGEAATTAVGGANGDYFTVHSLGTVQRTTADGKQLWMRDSLSLHADWQDKPIRVYQQQPYPGSVVMGFNAVSPFTPATDQGWTSGDLTGDGVDDFVFTAEVGVRPYRPFTSPGSTLPNGTFVTVLDGTTGKTLWTKLYAAAYNVKLVGKTLLIADSAYYNQNSPAGSKATLNGIRFSYADGKLTPAETWTHNADLYTGVAWGALEPIGGGLVAASWNQARRYTADLTPSGHTLVLDTADGSVKWGKTDRLYSRQLHLDASRGRIVALEQSDVNEGVKYEIAAYDPESGERSSLTSRINALPTVLEIGDIQGDAKPEYTVAESTVRDSLFVDSTTVRALNGDDAGLLWARTVKASANSGNEAGTAWGVQAIDGRIVVSYLDDLDSTKAVNANANHYARISVLAGTNGAVKWEKRGIVGSALGTQSYVKDGGWRLRTVDTNQNVRVYNLGSGKQEGLTPLQGVLYAGAGADVNGDKKQDLVAGGTSNGLFAYDGPSLVAGTPKRLWTAVLPGRVVQITKADTTGDGRDEFVVAADTAAAVVDAGTGKVLTVIEGGSGEYVRNVVASDLDGDGDAEIAIGTDKLRAYQGDGTLLWQYSVPAEIGTPAFADLSASHGQVYAQYQTRGVNPGVGGVPVGQVALRGKDGSVVWSTAPKAPAGTTGAVLGIHLRAGTFASPDVPYADGHGVAYTYVARTDASTWPANTIRVYTQIRDGRTGELLHESWVGGYATLTNWYTAPEGLIASGYPFLAVYAPGTEHRNTMDSDIYGSAPVTGPTGERLIAAAGTGFGVVYDASILAPGQDYVHPVNGYDALGARELFTGDLDGDGVDEMVLLNFDEYGADRTADLVGNSVSMPYTAIRSMITLTIDKA